jgi:hypothetical protein
MPPIFRGQFATEVLGTSSGRTIVAGVGICMLGIVFAGMAGASKEREMSGAQKRVSIKEFDLKKGLLVATFSGVMSACFAYGLAAGDPIKEITVRYGTPALWQGLLSCNDFRLHFGLGAAAKAEVRVRWLDGEWQTIGSVPINQLVTIKEGQGIIPNAGWK